MSEIIVHRENDRWSAFSEGRRIVSSKCKPCVIKILRSLTKNSTCYKEIVVFDSEGHMSRIKTGSQKEKENGDEGNRQES